MFNLVFYAILAIAIMGMIGAGVSRVKQWGANEVQTKWDQAISEQTKEDLARSALASTRREADRAKSKVVYQTIKERVVEYIDRPVYSSVCIDSDGLRDINRALLGPVPDPGESDH